MGAVVTVYSIVVGEGERVSGWGFVDANGYIGGVIFFFFFSAIIPRELIYVSLLCLLVVPNRPNAE